MTIMENNLLMCGFSYHKQPFYIDNKCLSHYLFRLQTEGASRASVNGELTLMTPGSLLLHKPGDAYELVIDSLPGKSGQGTVSSGDYYLACTGQWVDEWWERTPRHQLNRINMDERLISQWRLLLLEHRRVGEKNEELIQYLLCALCLCIDRAIRETSTPQGRSFTAQRMKNYIEEHAATPFKIEDAANYVGLSVSRAVHLFKECFGTTMIRYAQEVRLASALERIMYSTMTLEQIAETSGFASYTYFHRVFREKYKMSPSEYRSRSITGTAGTTGRS